MDCTIYVAKTKALISYAVIEQLIYAFVFAYAKIMFSHDAARVGKMPAFMSKVHATGIFLTDTNWVK